MSDWPLLMLLKYGKCLPTCASQRRSRKQINPCDCGWKETRERAEELDRKPREALAPITELLSGGDRG